MLDTGVHLSQLWLYNVHLLKPYTQALTCPDSGWAGGHAGWAIKQEQEPSLRVLAAILSESGHGKRGRVTACNRKHSLTVWGLSRNRLVLQDPIHQDHLDP